MGDVPVYMYIYMEKPYKCIFAKLNAEFCRYMSCDYKQNIIMSV